MPMLVVKSLLKSLLSSIEVHAEFWNFPNAELTATPITLLLRPH